MTAAIKHPDQHRMVTIPGTRMDMPVRAPHPYGDHVPDVDESYSFRKPLVRALMYAIKEGENVMLVGDAGVGKTSLVEQLAAHTNTPLRRVNLHGETDTTLFVGRDKPTMVDGERTLVYQWGILAEAMSKGWWLLLDEIDAALQPVLFILQQVLEDGGKLLLEDGQGTVVRKHPDFRIFATANSVGIAGRNRLLYSGTMGRMNEATLDRFGVVLHVDPLDEKTEIEVLCAKVPKLDPDFAKAIVKIANDVRGQLQNEQLTCTFSTRRCIHWAKALDEFHPVHAAKMTILNKLNQDDYQVLEGVISRYFGPDNSKKSKKK